MDERDPQASPRKDDISVCIACGALLVFNEDLTLRLPAEEEYLRLSLDPRVIGLQLARDATVPEDLIKRRKR
jgi:hypothetical protein